MRTNYPWRRPLCLALLVSVGLGLSGLQPSPAAARPTWGRPHAAATPLTVRALAYDRTRHAVVLSVTGQLAVSTRTVPNPTRLVVDLPGARLTIPKLEVMVSDGLVQRVRLAQFSMWPPVVRVVIEPTGVIEPTVAVQQTGKRLYISVSRMDEASPAPEAPPLPAVPELAPPEGTEPDRIPPVPLPPAPAGASSVPPLTRPGIQQRLRPDLPVRSTAPTRPATPVRPVPTPAPSEADSWPTLLPSGGPRQAPLEPAPLPTSSTRPIETVPDVPEPGVPVLPPGAEFSGEPEGFPTPAPLPRRGTDPGAGSR